MNSQRPGDAQRNVEPEPVSPDEIRVSREAIQAAENVLGRSLRSEVPDLPPERRPKD
jgi:hypothetical protein